MVNLKLKILNLFESITLHLDFCYMSLRKLKLVGYNLSLNH